MVTQWLRQWWVTLPIYTTIQSKLEWHLPPFLSSSPHHSQTANISSQSVSPHHYHQYVIKLYPSSADVKMVIGFRQLWYTCQSLKPITFTAPPASATCSTSYHAVPFIRYNGSKCVWNPMLNVSRSWSFWSNQRLGNLPRDISSGDLAVFKGSDPKHLCVSLRDWHESKVW